MSIDSTDHQTYTLVWHPWIYRRSGYSELQNSKNGDANADHCNTSRQPRYAGNSEIQIWRDTRKSPHTGSDYGYQCNGRNFKLEYFHDILLMPNVFAELPAADGD